MAVVAGRGVVGAVGVTLTVTVAADDKVVTELLVVALEVPNVPRLHTMLVVVEELALLQIPETEPVVAESSEAAVPKVEAVNMPPLTGSPML